MMDLGFGEKVDPDWVSNRYFPSKIGGRPAWLDLRQLPSNLQCINCKNPKTFLCQIYAPYDDAYNFHRTIYIFVCRSPECQEAHSAKNLTVLRSQLPKANEFYSEHPPDENGEPLPAIPATKKLCVVCGCLGPLTCGRCRNSNYCSTQHQRVHWKNHKTACSPENTSAGVPLLGDEILKGIVYPEWEIVMEEANASVAVQTDDDEENEQKRLEEFAQMEAEGKIGVLNDVPSSELEQYVNNSTAVDDKFFRKFRKEIKREPKQVLRYQRGVSPLWMADPIETIAFQLNVPECPWCKGPRQFEFQVMPQMLVLIDDDETDWGVLAVYTCAKSCELPKDVQYVDEYIIKQDVTN